MSTQRIESFLCGEWKSGSGTGSELVNPTTEAVIATADTTGLDFAAALAFARDTGGPALRAMTFAERGELLQQPAVVGAVHAREDGAHEAAVVDAQELKVERLEVDCGDRDGSVWRPR